MTFLSCLCSKVIRIKESLDCLSLSASNQRWLGERLIEAAREDKDIKKVKQQEAMVKDTLTRAFEELHAGEVYDDARSLFNDQVNMQ